MHTQLHICIHTHAYAQHSGNVELGPGLLVEELERLRVSMETQLVSLAERMERVEDTVTTLTSRVTALEQSTA